MLQVSLNRWALMHKMMGSSFTHSSPTVASLSALTNAATAAFPLQTLQLTACLHAHLLHQVDSLCRSGAPSHRCSRSRSC